MQRARKTGTWSYQAIAVAASVAVALQAVLLTFAPPVGAAATVVTHEHQEHEHHAQQGDDAQGRPADVPSHHLGLCCILGSKLGTALGPVAAPPSLPTPAAVLIVTLPLHGTITIDGRPQSGTLGARAPPLAT
jgi:hypothetical protein